MPARVLMVIIAVAAVCTAAIAQNGATAPQPYPTVFVSLAPAPATPSPDPITQQRIIARARLLACINERKIAETALVETAKGDGVVGGVMKRLGETRFTLDDLMGDNPPGYVPTPMHPELNIAPATPLPFTTPVATLIIARDAARDSSKPYWTGTRKLLDASGDLEKSVRAAAAAVDKLQSQVNIDPDPVRRAQVQQMIAALTSAVKRQAPLVKDVEQFILSADTQLSSLEMRAATNMNGGNPQYPVYSPLLNRDPESDGYKLLTQATSAHEATEKAVKLAADLNTDAFAECSVPHPQATPLTSKR